MLRQRTLKAFNYGTSLRFELKFFRVRSVDKAMYGPSDEKRQGVGVYRLMAMVIAQVEASCDHNLSSEPFY